ncbi:methionyl-tRNA formyltransferase [Krasilnikovia cinnamomea]|uniref:Methionyl-tRNA formyltransferase n=1 Tax=Krasilnikovia cinnamomea TaxID=349313 RepID=A0A4Q7ZPU9_9ACTN|nr:formyltransferase family protein [Krasilnikovia cinnamomea]RZU52563.1 methionyl-tRNA formyltransferase [Krasilnikovia cinnamomea]
MTTLNLYAMTAKGLAVFDALCAAVPGVMRAVISARDPGTRDGSYDALAAACAQRGVSFFDRSQVDAVPPAAYAMAVGWRWIIPDRPDTTLVVFHDSLLPRHRGFNPLVTALIEGDARAGVTALLATAEYDRGDILAQVAVPLPRPIRIAEAIDLVAAGYAEIAADIGARIAAGQRLSGVPQDERAASYSLWRDDADYEMDWAGPADRLRDFVYAVGPPYAGARTRMNGVPVRVWDVAVEPDVAVANRAPGKVIFLRGGRPTVVCGTGLLRIDAMTRDDDGGTNCLPLRRFRTRFG